MFSSFRIGCGWLASEDLFKYIPWTMHNVKFLAQSSFGLGAPPRLYLRHRAGANVDSAAAAVHRRILYASPASLFFIISASQSGKSFIVGTFNPRLTFFNPRSSSRDSAEDLFGEIIRNYSTDFYLLRHFLTPA